MATLFIIPKLSLAHKVVAGFAAAFFMVLALGIMADAANQRELTIRRQMAQAQSVIDELGTTLSLITDNETGTRGYVITGDDSYLEPYYTAISTVDSHLKHLRSLISDDPTQLANLIQLEPKIEQKLDFSRDVVALRRKVSFEAAQEKIVQGTGKALMDDIRSAVAHMQSVEHSRLDAMSDELVTSATGTGWLLATVPFCLAFIALIYTIIGREMRGKQRSEQALIASENRFKAIIENTADPIFIKDLQGRYTMINSSGANIFGLSSQDIVGMDDIDLFGEEKGRAVIEKDRQAIEVGLLTYESPVSIHGKTLIYNTAKFPYLSTDGELLGVIGISRDVTEARGVEAQLRKQKAELSALNDTTLGLVNGLDTQSLLEAIVINAASLLGIPDTFLYVLEPDEQTMMIRAANGRFLGSIGDVRVKYGEGLAGRVWEYNKTMVIEDYTRWEHRLPELDVVEMRAIVEVPLRAGGEVMGVLGMAHTGGNSEQIHSEEVELLSRFAQMASVALQNAQLYEVAQQEIRERKRAEEALHELAIRDELTELYNRREFMRLLSNEVARCKRYGGSMSLILLDLDHFKHVNDTYGHQIGDTVLAWLSGILSKTIRSVDCVARYGGEEFAVIVPELSAHDAWEFAERLRLLVASTACEVWVDEEIPLSLWVTVSAGVSSLPADGESQEALIAAADRALYVAKGKGRNRTIMHSDELATRTLGV